MMGNKYHEASRTALAIADRARDMERLSLSVFESLSRSEKPDHLALGLLLDWERSNAAVFTVLRAQMTELDAL